MKKLKRILRSALYLAMVGAFLAVFAFANRDYSERTPGQPEVEIANANRFHFLDADMVIGHLEKNQLQIEGLRIGDIDPTALRNSIREMPAVKQADVFRSVDGRIRIRIEQRTPLCRILNADGSGFYLDEDGRIMPLSNRYTAHVLVFTGNLQESAEYIDVRHVSAHPELASESMLESIYRMALHIENDPFLRDFCEHVVVNSDREFDIVPRLGDLRIRFGTGHFLDTKTKKLKLFYGYALKNLNLNQYSKVDLRFRKQVVCTKRV